MWIMLVVALVNFIISFVGRRFLKLPGIDLIPIGIIIIAQSGDSVLFGSLLLMLSYIGAKASRLRYLWLVLPVTILIGYLSLVLDNAVLLIFLYHVICGSVAFFFKLLGGRYLLFFLINLGLNIVAARLWTLLR